MTEFEEKLLLVLYSLEQMANAATNAGYCHSDMSERDWYMGEASAFRESVKIIREEMGI